ncbi:tight junction-associated 1-like [Brachionus plicatilis]|uniref:Tight junction-associated 1-like n=1 Tax=Brachionus plicatilis TaxID=10195 RepID=A0A3M7Q8C2_BRAPC|nr:tight junction-associated 1-like [Brachionus plicatilis]
MNIWNTNSDSFDLNCQIEELKGLLRSNDLLLKDERFKHNKIVEKYEAQISRLNDENKAFKEKYDRVYDVQRKLEKINSDLEERLLKIVEKYENEQKTLLEDLTIAHSKLVEANLTIEDLEKQKDTYKQDCNLAVSLLQCKPNDFVSHSYKSLPNSIRNRLKSHLSHEDIEKLKTDNSNGTQTQTIPKIPIFQPSAAAALMYTYQNERVRQNKIDEEEPNDDIDHGYVSTSLLAHVLKIENEEKTKNPIRLYPHICLRCKKQLVLVDTETQTEQNHGKCDETKILMAKPRSILSNEPFSRSKSIGNNLVDFNGDVNDSNYVKNSHNKSASTDFGSFKNVFLV